MHNADVVSVAEQDLLASAGKVKVPPEPTSQFVEIIEPHPLHPAINTELDKERKE